MRRLWGAAVLMCATFGCATWKPTAAASLMCPEDRIESEHTGQNLLVLGCDRVDVLYSEKDREWSSLRARAAFEMSCNTSAIDIAVLSPQVYGVTGCDKKYVYRDFPVGGIRLESSQPAPATP